MVQCTVNLQVLLRTCIVMTLMYGPVHANDIDPTLFERLNLGNHF